MTEQRATPERLREVALTWGPSRACSTDYMLRAASTIEALERELAEARERIAALEQSYGHVYCQSYRMGEGCAVCGFATEDRVHISEDESEDE